MGVKAQQTIHLNSVEDIKTTAEAARDTAASSKIIADSAATAARTAQTAADAAQSSAATAAQAAATAQSTADAAKASASSASNAANAAQTKANEAASAAATAQSKADSAGTAAAKVQSSANAAGEAASSAQAAAEAAKAASDELRSTIEDQEQHFWHDENGAHVQGVLSGTTKFRVDITSYGLSIKDISSTDKEIEVANFTASGAVIGKTDETHAVIDTDSFNIVDAKGYIRASLGGETPMVQIGKFVFVNRDNGNLTLRLTD